MSKDYDPRMHSAEHILNQTMNRMLGCRRCFSSHIEKKKSKCDYRFERNLSDAEIGEIEERVNAIIAADLPVTAEYISREEAEKSYNIARLPEEAGDRIRIVRVGEFDACPCIGPHVDSTGSIGDFRITSTRCRDGVLRLIFRLAAAP